MKKIIILLSIISITLSNAQQHHFEWDASLGRFENGLEDQVAYINFGDAKIWGFIEVTITGGFGYRLTTGKYTKRFQIAKNPQHQGGYFFQSSEVPNNFGHVGDEWKIGELEFVNNTLRVPIYHLLTTGNTPHIYINGTSVTPFDTGNISITPPATVPNNEERDYKTVVSHASGGEGKIHFQNGTTAANGSITLALNPNDVLNRGAEIQALAETPNQTALVFKTNSSGLEPSERMRIDTQGNIGIGTTTPSEKLHVAGNLLVKSGNQHEVLLYPKLGVDPQTGLSSGYIQVFDRVNGSYTNSLQFRANGYSFNRGVNGVPIMYIGENQRVGIGTTTPNAKLSIKDSGASLDVFGDTNGSTYLRSNDGEFRFRPNGSTTNKFSLSSSRAYFANSVGIGIDEPPVGYKLAVVGKVITEEVKVKLESRGWPDYVFANSYNLPTLTEVENHIKEKGHLKDIPSAKEVEKNGLYLGEINSKLLQKIEELTLYTIQQEKRIKELEEKNKIVEQENKTLKSIEARLKIIETYINKE